MAKSTFLLCGGAAAAACLFLKDFRLHGNKSSHFSEEELSRVPVAA